MDSNYVKDFVPALTPLTVVEEASRCLLCHDAPCSKACPAGTDPGKFIRSVRFRNFKGAAETIRINNALGAICARVCPQEKYCQLGCSRSGIDRPIEIGQIQRYVTDMEDALHMEILEAGEPKGQSVAIIGGGPSGLALSAKLLGMGYSVSIFEKEDRLGGYLISGIPEYRLPTEIVEREIKRIVDLGLDVHLNSCIGKDVLIDDLKEDFDAVVVAIGSSIGKMLPAFENNPYVETATSFLKRCKAEKGHILIEDNVLVVGGGDVAMDVCTSLKLLGAPNVTDVVYEEFFEFRASKKELEGAEKMGVTIMDGYVPTEVKGNTVKFKHRRIPGEVTITADKIILAIGQAVDPDGTGLDIEKGEITFPNYQDPEDKKVWAIGDISHNDKSVVAAVRSAKEAAFYIDRYLGGK